MPTFTRPGVYVQETLQQLSNPINAPVAGLSVFVAAHSRGPLTPTLITSFSQFQRLYGSFAAGEDLAYAIFQYISNGGRAAYILRAAPADAVAASQTFDDGATTPVATLDVDAANPGAWGNDIYVEIETEGSLFSLTVYYGGVSQADVVESWNDLSLDPTNRRFAEAIINSPTAGSTYIRVTDNAASTEPPATIAPTVLSGGTDGTALTPADVVGELSTLDEITRSFTLSLPGITDSSALNTAITYAEDRGNVFLVLDAPAGSTTAEAITFAEGLTATSYAGIYFPQLVIPDPNSSAANATRVVPAGPSVAGVMVQVDASRGVFKAPAGLTARLSNIVGLEINLSNDAQGDLNAAHVNALRYQVGTGFIVSGARTLERGTAAKYVPVRRTLNYLKEALIDGLQWSLFEVNDESLWESITVETQAFLGEFWRDGGLRGGSPDQAFYVKCDADLNTPAVIDAGEVRVEVGVALQRPAEFIVIRLGQWEGGQTAVEIEA